MKPSFLTRHPYYKNLLKFAGYIFVGWNTLFLCALGPLFFLMIIGIAMTADVPESSLSLTPVYGEGYQQLLSIKVTGVIYGDSDDQASPLGGLGFTDTYGYEVKKKLYDAAKDDNIQGVVLEISSPGGTIYGSRAIADGVKHYRDKTKQPVYAFVSGVAASGGYWAATSADKIMADYGSDVGSIGVIMGPFKYYDKVISESGGLFDGGVVTQNGIETVNLSAGKFKDLGSPYRRLTKEETDILQRQINNDYDEFVSYVAERRKIDAGTIKGVIGAMGYDNKTAQAYKLIDQTASREATYEALADKAGIKDDYQVVREESPGGFISSLLAAVTGKPARQAQAATPAKTSCSLISTRLAYSGDISALCPAGK